MVGLTKHSNNTLLCLVRIFMKQTLELKNFSVLLSHWHFFFQISAGILMGHLQNQNQKRILGPNVTSVICQAQITILYVVTNVKDVIILAVLFLLWPKVQNDRVGAGIVMNAILQMLQIGIWIKKKNNNKIILKMEKKLVKIQKDTFSLSSRDQKS